MKKMSVVCGFVAVVGACGGAGAQEVAPRSALVVGGVARGGRTPIVVDAVAAQVVSGTWKPPKEGDAIALPGGRSAAWRALAAGEDGWFRARELAGGYAFVTVPSDAEKVMVLEASGHTLVYVNGEPRAGDPYSTGYVRLPVKLRRGDNALLFSVGRGQLRFRLVPPKADAELNAGDPTLPDLLTNESPKHVLGAVLVLNSTDKPLTGLRLTAARLDGPATETALPDVPPLSARKVPFSLPGRAPSKPGDLSLTLTLRNGRAALDTAKLTVRARRPTDSHRRTFVSAIDGSVQYYAVQPAPPAAKGAERPALFLSLHGASVEAQGQADAYAARPWGHLVAPTNRRPFGFDWEDWGRLDAIEVLEHARNLYKTDPNRTYLTGHSMGGHGTWQVGVTFPDRFAAIAPSAGWISFATYAGGVRLDDKDPILALMQRAALPSDTLALASNYAQQGVYILHGAADDNVPAQQARTMRDALAKFHKDFAYFEQPGAGHWWDVSDEPGADCVDWPPLFDLFARRRLPERAEVRDVDFATANPGVSAKCHWATIAQQTRPLVLSRVVLRCDPHSRRFSGTTENVALLALDARHLAPGVLRVELDGGKLENVARPTDGILWLSRNNDGWRTANAPDAAHKRPERTGPFKLAFQNRMAFVYGTGGTPDENAWAYAKARYDAETFWVRGNGAVDVVPDTDLNRIGPDRSVILYGNADTNAAWKTLLPDSPVQVTREAVKVGSRETRGPDLACLFLRPRPGTPGALVGVVAGTGINGLRLTDRLPYFTSGVAYPDVTLLHTQMLTEGAAGVVAAGFFGNDWKVETGEWAWRGRREGLGIGDYARRIHLIPNP